MNKKTANIIAAFILVFIFFVAILGISGHIPFIGEILSTLIALIMVIAVIIFFVTILKRRK